MAAKDDDLPPEHPWDERQDGDRPRRRFDDAPARRPAPRSNGLATAGLILGILSFCTVGLAAIPGLICSAIAMAQSTGRKTAIWGLVLNVLGGLVGAGICFALLMYSVTKVREAAARMTDQNYLKRITIGVHDYHRLYQTLPPANGQLSWRVHLLPFVEEDATFRQFDLKQPWDSVANMPLAGRTIKTFVSPSEVAPGPDTRYRVFVGPNTLFPPNTRPLGIAGVTDGLSNTFYAVEAGQTVPWPQPKELPYDRATPLPPLGFKHRNGFNVGLADGSVRFIRAGVAENLLRAGIEPADGRVFTE